MADRAPAALLSLHPKFAEAFLTGEKCVEVRRRRPHLPSGTKLWFYSKKPVASVVGVGTVREVLTDNATEIWSRYSQCAAISRLDFDEYLDGLADCSVITFSAVAAVTTPLPLSELRGYLPAFNPPQFFQWLGTDALEEALARTKLHDPVFSCDH